MVEPKSLEVRLLRVAVLFSPSCPLSSAALACAPLIVLLAPHSGGWTMAQSRRRRALRPRPR